MAVLYSCKGYGCVVQLYRLWLCCTSVQVMAVLYSCKGCGCIALLYRFIVAVHCFIIVHVVIVCYYFIDSCCALHACSYHGSNLAVGGQ